MRSLTGAVAFFLLLALFVIAFCPPECQADDDQDHAEAPAPPDDDDDAAQAPSASPDPHGKKGLRIQKVMQSSLLALSKLHSIVMKYQRDHQLSDERTQALLSDCLNLTDDSQDVMAESLSVLVKMHAANDSSSNKSRSNSKNSGLELVRTNLSAALTDITTCTDGLHDEMSDDSQQAQKAVAHIDKQAAKVSQLLSMALGLIAAGENE